MLRLCPSIILLTFGLLASEAASVIFFLPLWSCWTWSLLHWGVLELFGPRDLFVDVVRQVSHNTNAVFHRLERTRDTIITTNMYICVVLKNDLCNYLTKKTVHGTAEHTSYINSVCQRVAVLPCCPCLSSLQLTGGRAAGRPPIPRTLWVCAEPLPHQSSHFFRRSHTQHGHGQ